MTDKEIARLSAPVLQAYRDMEDELLRMIARQIGKDKRVSDTSKWMISHLARAGEVDRQALMIIDSYAGGVDAECAAAILAAAEGEAGTLDEAMLSLLSEKGEMTGDVQQALDAFSRQGRQELAVQDARIAEPYAQALTERCNMVNTVMGYSAVSAYNNAVREIARNAGEIDRSAVLREMNAGAASVVMGTESIQQATRQTIHRMAEKGLPGFVDKAGRQWSPEAYVRMDLRTTMGNTARAAQDARCDEWGIQLIEVSSHNGARPKCAPYQGRIFSRDGSRGVTRDLDGDQIEYIPLSETSYGEPDGLFGINCGHQQYPFIPGVSVRSYYPYPEEENAERYQQMQQQRAMERRIRDDKRECMMLQEAGDEEGLRKAAGKLRADKDRYKDFCKETGLGAHNENTQVYGYDRSKSMKTVWADKNMDYMSKSFRPTYAKAKSLSFTNPPMEGSIDDTKIVIPVKKVTNSKYTMFTDVESTRRNKAVRLVEDLMNDINGQLPQGFELPPIAVVDFEKHGIAKGKDAIGGYDHETGILFINSKYNTREKVLAYVNRQDIFANKTEYGPLLHELGHKNYYDSIKRLAKSNGIGYNEANKQIDSWILDALSGIDVKSNVSAYAYDNLLLGKLTEIAAECFSVRDTNSIAMKVVNSIGG